MYLRLFSEDQSTNFVRVRDTTSAFSSDIFAYPGTSPIGRLAYLMIQRFPASFQGAIFHVSSPFEPILSPGKSLNLQERRRGY